MPVGDWVQKVQHIACKLKARTMTHVMWWDVRAINPAVHVMYPLPHLKYSHDTGVVDFTVETNRDELLQAPLVLLGAPGQQERQWVAPAGRAWQAANFCGI